ncbi:MAG: alpha/beta hydrolase [Clostridia bacterium]|nr:alpha/beta hydrolase [Clostridia bacterium]
MKNGLLRFDDAEMDYIRFGHGPHTLIMLPGLGDGLTTVKGTALPMAVMYRAYARRYTVYVFSRRRNLPDGYTTRDMARDQARAMDTLGISCADVIGISMGGMVAQHLAADYPQKVRSLVLVVTSSRTNPQLVESITEWMDCAKRGDHRALMESNVRRMYTEAYYRKNRWLIPVMGVLTKPKSYNRFFIQADACLAHQAYDRLSGIRARTLVIGGDKDLSLGGDASREIAAAIDGARLHMYPQQGHALYEEAKDFNQVVLSFLYDGLE